MIKWIIGISITLLTLMVLSILLVITPIGTKISFAMAKKILPGKLHYQKVSGILIGPLNIKNFRYEYKDRIIDIKALHLQWKAYQLLIGRLDINKLTASHITITVPKRKEKSSFRLPNLNLPVSLKIDQAILKDIRIGNLPNQFPLQLKLIKFHGAITNNQLNVDLNARFIRPYAATVNLNLRGSTNQYQFKIFTHNQDMQWLIQGQGGNQWITFSTHQAHMLNGDLNGEITLHWNSQWQWQANINAHHINIQKFYRNLPKQISVKLITHGIWKNSQPNFSIDSTVQTPGALVQVTGKYDQQWNLQWKVAIATLSNLFAKYQGAVYGSGKLLGSMQQPHTLGKLNGKKLSLFGYHMTDLNAQWDVDSSYQQPSSIQLEAHAITTARIQLSEVKLQAKGNPKTHQLTAWITINNHDIGPTQMTLFVNGKLIKDIWQGQLVQFDINSRNFGQWKLDQPGIITYSSQDITFTPLCWHSKKGEACLQGKWDAHQSWEMTATATGIHLTPLLTLFKIHLPFHNPSTLHVTLTGQGKTIHQINTTITVTKGKDDLIATLNLPGYSLGKPLKQQPITGSLTMNMSHVAFLSEIFPQIIKPTGKLVGNLNISGTVANPSIRGDIALENGSVQIPQLNLNLKKITLSMEAQGALIHYTLQAYSQNQLIQLKGTTDINLPDHPTQLSIEGKNILVINTQEYEIYVNPMLEISIQGRHIDVKGTLTVPKALLEPINFKYAVTLPEDVIFVGPAAKKSSLWLMTMNVDIILGQDVTVDTHGFNGKLTGQLTMTKTPTHIYLATGKIAAVDATFTIANKTFIISSTSNVTYNSVPIDDPSLNIQATRMIKLAPGTDSQLGTLNSLTVGLNIQGTLRKPNVSLFSIPSDLTQADILSYLIFGHPANANTPGNISLLLQTVDTLHLGSGADITPGGLSDKIAQGLGLSEFGIESGSSLNLLGTQQQSAFVIGRYISPNIYVRYSRGLIIPINIVQVRYLIGKHWAIQTNSSSLGTGGDVLYSIQTN